MNSTTKQSSILKYIGKGSYIKLGLLYVIIDVIFDYFILSRPQSDELSLTGILFNIESTDPVLLPASAFVSAIWLTIKIVIVAESINFSLQYFLPLKGIRKSVLMIALICQFIFLASNGLHLTFNYYFDLEYLSDYNLLSLASLFGHSEMSPEWLFILSSANIFILAYIYIFSNLIFNYLQITDFNKVFYIVGGTFLFIYLIKVVINFLLISSLPS